MGKTLEDKHRTNSPRKLHLLFAGELSDPPMRYESWKDYLVYFGWNTWRITTVEGNEVTRHPIMSTTQLVEWVLDGDQRMEGSTVQNDPDDEPGYKLSFGPFSSRLYEIAKKEHAHHCISCLESWRRGEPVRRKKEPAIRIIAIKGMTKRGIWLHIYQTVFDVDTNLGSAYLYPPTSNNRARLVFTNEVASSPGRLVRLTKANCLRITEISAALKAETCT